MAARATLVLAAVWLLSVILWLQPGVVRPDGAGHIVYLPSTWIDRDLLLFNEWEQLGLIRKGVIRFKGITPTDHLSDHWSAGPAMAWYPAFVFMDGVRSLTTFPRNGISLPYNLAVVMTSAFAGLVTLLLGVQLARRWFPTGPAMLAGIAVWFGTPLLWYSVRHATTAHAVSAAACAAVVVLTIRMRGNGSRDAAFAVGLALGFAAAVRIQNAAFVLVPLLALVGEDRRRLLRRAHWFILGGVAGILPQLVVSHVIYGNPLGFANVGTRAVGWDPLTKVWLAETLFSWYHGAFSWTPLVAVAVAGLFVLRRTDRPLANASLVSFAVQWIANATADRAFWAGVSFGQRRFDNCTIFFLLGIAALAHRARATAIVATACCAWTMALFFAAGGLDLNAYQTLPELLAAMELPRITPLAMVPSAARATVAWLGAFALSFIGAIGLVCRVLSPRARTILVTAHLVAMTALFVWCGMRDGKRIEHYRTLIERNRSGPGQRASDVALLQQEITYLRKSGRTAEAAAVTQELLRLSARVPARP